MNEFDIFERYSLRYDGDIPRKVYSWRLGPNSKKIINTQLHRE